MKAFFINEQRFDVNGRFSVEQRRYAWTLRIHPKKFCKAHGCQYSLVRVKRMDDMTFRELSTLQDHFRKLLMSDAMAIQKIAEAIRKRAGIAPKEPGE